MKEEIRAEVLRRGITRLCHFTPSRNLLHIAAGRSGILSTGKLRENERQVLNQTDLQRLDGKINHVCCSVEFPNGWYFAKSRENEQLFKDWVILFIRPDHLWEEGTLFAPRNAAANYGGTLMSGIEGFQSMFCDKSSGAYGKTFVRSPSHLLCSPTDDQAEVLVADRIPAESILSVCLFSDEQVEVERVRLRVCGIPEDSFSFTVAPELFDKYALSGAIRSGKRIIEKPWTKGMEK